MLGETGREVSLGGRRAARAEAHRCMIMPWFLDRQRDNRADDVAVNLRAKRIGQWTK